jgi:hypothetical protein
MKTVVGLFDNFTEAQRVLQALIDGGYSRTDISLVAADREGKYADELYGRTTEGEVETDAGSSAVAGAVGGGLLGGAAGLVVGLAALTIPGLGPVIAAGPLASALVGAGVGIVTGGVLGALVGWGIPEEHAEYYAEGIRRGGTLVAVKAEENQVNDISNIMQRYNPVNIEKRSATWQQSGWSGFEADDDDYIYYEPSYRRHYNTNYATKGRTYDYYAPAYRYGYDLAYNESYNDDEWYEVEIEARRGWEEEHEGIWENFKDAVRHGWQEVKDVFDADDYYYYEPGYRRHHQQNYVQNGRNYDYYAPGYRYGYTLGFNGDYNNYNWAQLEPLARDEWQKQSNTAWEDIKGSVRHAWEEVKDAVADEDWHDESETNFHRHYYTYYSHSPYSYGRYLPAYRYGYKLAKDSPYTHRDWNDVSEEAARDWDDRFEGAWNDFKEAVRHGWEEGKRTVRQAV